jgi:hypothetical protein
VFVTFAGIEPPNSINETEARWLHGELLRGVPREPQVQAALKIQRGWEQGVDVQLGIDEKRAVVAVVNVAALPSNATSEALRWLQRNMRRSLGEDVY